jgi:aldehyde:ferredoxin oxidoreductase
MGSKKLRAIAVRGHQKVEVANTRVVRSIARWYRDNFKNSKSLSNLSAHGTARAFTAFNRRGALPTSNFREGTFEGSDKISAEAIEATALKKRGGCYACPVQCKPVVSLAEPYDVNPIYGGLEFESQVALGSLCGVDNLASLLEAMSRAILTGWILYPPVPP